MEELHDQDIDQECVHSQSSYCYDWSTFKVWVSKFVSIQGSLELPSTVREDAGAMHETWFVIGPFIGVRPQQHMRYEQLIHHCYNVGLVF